MTREAYNALEECARRRIEREWPCTEAERAVLSLVNELSFALGQSLALVPSLGDFAGVTGLHKSTISRAVRSALKKGFLMIVKRREETLYGICTETAGKPEETDDNSREKARARLLEMNENRLQGRADGNGQQRLPGILPNEEVEAPVRAFAAMLEVPVPVAEKPRVTAVAVSVPEEGEDALTRLQQTMERRRGEHLAAAVLPSVERPDDAYLEVWQEATRGLRGEALFALEQLREECALAGRSEVRDLMQFRFAWRKRAMSSPRLMAESVGVCKAMRLEGKGPKQPGAFVYRTMQAAKGAMGADSS